ncbi:TPA: hypothetical protein ACH3X3_003642 [Trebouxia sp. C0006]
MNWRGPPEYSEHFGSANQSFFPGNSTSSLLVLQTCAQVQIAEIPLIHETVGLPLSGPEGASGGGASGGLGRVLCCVLTAQSPQSAPFAVWTANVRLADRPGHNSSVEMISIYLEEHAQGGDQDQGLRPISPAGSAADRQSYSGDLPFADTGRRYKALKGSLSLLKSGPVNLAQQTLLQRQIVHLQQVLEVISRSQLSAGQERQEGLISQVSVLEQAQAALQAASTDSA